jgi:hypothetical protein
MPVFQAEPPTGRQQMSQAEVDHFIEENRQNASRENSPVLSIDLHHMMTAKRGGFPKHMYHPTLEMRMALSRKDEVALRSVGYGDKYIMREYPCAIFRRNLSPRFEERFDPGTGVSLGEPFVEQALCKTEADWLKLSKRPTPKDCGPWVKSTGEIEPLPDAGDVDPQAVIQRLEGQLAEARRQADAKPKKESAA